MGKHRKIIDYKIIEEEYNDNLEEKVKEAILKGWEPLGGPFSGNYFDDEGEVEEAYIGQAMVRYEEDWLT